MFKNVIIDSNDVDLKGSWKKDDIEEEMKDVGIEIQTPNEWIEYLIDHVFNGVDDSPEIGAALDAIATNDAIEKMHIRGNDFWVQIIKEK